jgi:2'-5' RNA ligase
MTQAVAIDVALLPPSEVTARAIALNAALPSHGFRGLRLDAAHLPHVTLSQQFVPMPELGTIVARVETVAAGHPRILISVTGGGRSGKTVWMAIRRTGALDALHQGVMAALEPFELPRGAADAFIDGQARPGDVAWVSSFRRASSFDAFTPHLTLGHAEITPTIEPFDFIPTRLAVCHLGRFCTCQRVLAEWRLE